MQEFLNGGLSLIIYIAVMVTVVFSIKLIFKVPRELFRKMLHMIAVCFIFVLVSCYETWWIAALTAALLAIVVYPALAFGEKYIDYSKLLIQRKNGEIKSSLIIVFAMFTLIITICWGLLNDRMLALASVCAWGFGDAAAALIGKKFGRHKLEIRRFGVKKSWEGTISMFTVSFVAVVIVLGIRGGFSPASLIITAVLTAAVSAVTELVTIGGNDTITCPVAAMIILVPMTYLFGGGF